MDGAATVRWTRFCAIGAVVLTAVGVPLWFVHAGAPPVADVGLRFLVDMLDVTLLLGFWVGLRTLAVRADPRCEVAATLAVLAATMLTVLVLVAEASEYGAALRGHGLVDPTLVGSGAEGAVVVLGPVNRLVTATALLAAAAALLRSRVVPRAVAVVGAGVGLVHLALVPTLFSTTDPASFLSINGWNIPVVDGLYLVWVLVTAVLLRAPVRATDAGVPDRRPPAKVAAGRSRRAAPRTSSPA